MFAKVRVFASPRRVCIAAAASGPLGAMRATKNASSDSLYATARAVGPPLSALTAAVMDLAFELLSGTQAFTA